MLLHKGPYLATYSCGSEMFTAKVNNKYRIIRNVRSGIQRLLQDRPASRAESPVHADVLLQR